MTYNNIIWEQHRFIMSGLSSIDTYKHIKELTRQGASETLAEAITNMVKESQEVNLSFLATKLDLQEVKAEMQELRAELKTDIQEVRAELKEMGLRTDIKLAQLENKTTKLIYAVVVLQVLIPIIQGLLPLIKH